MIAKHVSMKTVQKSDFAGLVKYITDQQSKNERVGYVSVTNCCATRPDMAITEVLNTQALNKRSAADKTYHLVVSFRAGEQPDQATLQAIEKSICEGLGFGEHQRVSAVHTDTDNLHIHIAINKIHPVRYTTHEPYYPHKELAKLCEKLEIDFGLERDNHRAVKVASENRAHDMERHAGVESLLGWIQRECVSSMQAAQSWEALHQAMRDSGLELRERGNGLVIQASDGLTVKASSIGREFSKPKLGARLGTFEPSPEHFERVDQKTRIQYDKKPMRTRVNTVELHAKYKAEQFTLNGSRAAEWTKARAKKDQLIEAAKRSGRLKRSAIKLISGAGVGKRLMYSATSKTLKAEVEKINKQYLKERQEIHEKYQRRAWADWLRAKAAEGDQEALGALRAREAAQGLKGNTVAGTGPLQRQATAVTQDSVTKKGTIIYRVGATAVRDDGDRLKVSREANQDGMQTALRMAMERYGDRINVGGTPAFKEQIVQAAAASKLPITFDDAALERRRQQLLTQATTKEDNHDSTERRRTPGSSPGRSGPAIAATPGAARTGQPRADAATAERTSQRSKPNVGSVGRKPPPASQNRLRRLSQLGVVQLASGSEVLLPRDVPRDVEQQGAKPVDGLRRDIFRAGRLSPQSVAAEKYIAERESKRLDGFDIPIHSRYTQERHGAATFAGIRKVEGQSLALLKSGETVMVLPIDEPTAQRLKRLAIGDSVTLTPQGSIRTKGRSR